MTILPDGKVGIGTASPTTLLDVADTSGTTFTVRNTGTISSILLSNGSSTNQIFSRGVSSSTGRPLAFIQGTTEAMRINADGLVGINETSPSAQLQVKSGATDRVGLSVTTTATTGYTANIASFSANGAERIFFENNGNIRTRNGVSNYTGATNAYINVSDTGTVISRNVADSNPALIVNLTNATSTGHIQVWQSQTDAKAHITRTGIFVGQTRPTQNEQTGNYTLALADEGKVLRVNSSSNRTITIPKNSVVAFPIDTEIAILRYGTGTVSIAPVDGDVTLQSADGERKIRNRYGSVALKKIGENEWVLVGSLEA
jgi:hypothetical protein